MKQRDEKQERVPLSGCLGCWKPCMFNGLVATEKDPDKTKYGCNSSKERT